MSEESGVPRSRPTLTLITVCVAGGLLPLSLTGSSMALPGINADLEPGLAALQWVVNAYNLLFASLMLAAGSLADRLGRRRMFVIGSVLFASASAVSAAAGHILVIDVARAIAGVGAAAVLTSGSAILAQTFQGPALGKAFGALGTSFGFGLAFGPFLSGLLVSAGGWRAVFAAHAAVSLLVLLVSRLLPESRSAAATRVDWLGTITFSGSLLAFVLAVVQAPQIGWTDPVTVALFVGCALLMVAFVFAERRQAAPMFDLSLFRQSRYVAACLVPVALAFGFVTLLVLLPSYLISVDGVSAQRAGVTLLLLTAPTLIMPSIAGYLSRWVSARVLLVVTLLLVGGGAAWLTVIDRGVGVLTIAGPLLTIGVGMGISLAILDATAVSSVEPERAGMAAGMFNTMRLSGEVVAIATMGSVLAGLTQARLAEGIGGFQAAGAPSASEAAGQIVAGDLGAVAERVAPESRAAFVDFAAGAYSDGFHTALWVLAIATVLAAPVIGVLLRERKAAATGLHSEPAARSLDPVA
ncbi:MFS transporter [Actinoplanes sp. NPDC023801]|uniref:MFS transporter n=1 Tax=Actinoplanes sp. NPDC023801 TaxID=3154595 RepID=UPI0033CC567C